MLKLRPRAALLSPRAVGSGLHAVGTLVIERCLDLEGCVLFIVDGANASGKAIRLTFGADIPSSAARSTRSNTSPSGPLRYIRSPCSRFRNRCGG